MTCVLEIIAQPTTLQQ